MENTRHSEEQVSMELTLAGPFWRGRRALLGLCEALFGCWGPGYRVGVQGSVVLSGASHGSCSQETIIQALHYIAGLTRALNVVEQPCKGDAALR